MSSIRFSFDWVEFGSGEDHPWLQASFAQLTITVGNSKVTRVIDKRAQTTREFVIVPLYPLAEWLVANWWSFFEESEVPSRGVFSDEYRSRHAIREGREGYAFPELEFFPEGQWTRLAWKPSAAFFQPVAFLESGFDHVATDELRQAVADLIDAVVGRLEANGIADTWLQEEWQSIRSVDPEEREFCVAAGWLGLDPFNLDDEMAAEIVQTTSQLPLNLREEVLKASPIDKLSSAAGWVRQGLDVIQSNTSVDGAWNKLRERVPQTAPLATMREIPWKIGYQLARELRTILRLGDAFPINIDEMVGSAFPTIEAGKPPAPSFDGLVGVGQSSICCFTPKRRRDSKRFICTRGLLGFLFEKSSQSEFYSSAQTNYQQRSRAFAAEFLAPAMLIAKRLSGDDISDQEVEELASDFEVSTFVIEYQIQNQGLGRIIV